MPISMIELFMKLRDDCQEHHNWSADVDGFCHTCPYKLDDKTCPFELLSRGGERDPYNLHDSEIVDLVRAFKKGNQTWGSRDLELYLG